MNRPQGHGVMIYQNGNIFDGDWEGGERSGYGTLIYHNGDTYEGDWSSDNRHGQGNQ